MQTHLTDSFWFSFTLKYPHLKLDANRSILEAWCRQNNLIIASADTFEFAMAQIPNMLATIPPPDTQPEEKQLSPAEVISAENQRLRELTPLQLHREIRAS